jgi:hypothetical protein
VGRTSASGERDTKVHRDFEEAELETGMGLIRKALFIATFGLSGLVIKDNNKKRRPAQQTKKAARPAQAKARAAKAQSARRSKSKATRARAGARSSANGTSGELERVAKLHAQGALTDAEFAAGKAKILGTPAGHADAVRPEPTVQPAGIARSFPAVEANITAARQLAGGERPQVPSWGSN